jgi:hypothetical protein
MKAFSIWKAFLSLAFSIEQYELWTFFSMIDWIQLSDTIELS